MFILSQYVQTGVLQNLWQPTTDHRPTDRSSTNPPTTDNWPPTHWQVLHRLTDHRQPTINPSTGPPPTHQPLSIDHQPIDRSSTDPPTTNNRPPTNWQISVFYFEHWFLFELKIPEMPQTMLNV